SFGLSELPKPSDSLESVVTSRFSPSKSILKFQRRSISQPVLEPLTLSDDDDAPPIAKPTKNGKRAYKARTQKPAPSSLPSSPSKRTQGGAKQKKA
ncbi:hypothetical protein PFISCL1PPCAC_22070, partial [Pristionchus fissidentatus]